MNLNTLILYSIISVVLIGIPVILSRKLGKNPMELLFGDRVNRTIFGRKKNKETEARELAKKKARDSKNDLLTLVSSLATYARRHHFQLIVPGTLSCNDTIAVLTAILITRSMVVGINCFGFGGSITARAGNKDWMQLLDGVQKPFPSPVVKNQAQEKLVRQVLAETGWPDTEVEIIGIFTAPSVRLYSTSGTNCYTREDAINYLESDRFLRDAGLDPTRLQQSLSSRVVRTQTPAGKQAGTQIQSDEAAKPGV